MCPVCVSALSVCVYVYVCALTLCMCVCVYTAAHQFQACLAVCTCSNHNTYSVIGCCSPPQRSMRDPLLSQ